MTRDEVFAELRRRGADMALVDFSGGNDEGGADSIRLRNGGEDVGTIDPDTWNRDNPDKELAVALEEPVYERYGSFAGDFSVSGTVTWDVTQRKVTMHKSESEYVDSELEV